ncbi:helix-turn-helix domain-containing protein [Phaeocystidibacter luteus]|uniref:AraC family transcriptional regulator n=1 Tax=Phaeocystidibacter luteus TaxID=911197 RepID=A0A6N6RKC8_9FLAO|nr:AraC family transcriptional regulator [Phaeocystidibacter luteus]KAB2809916.1 AraC family transcriptional regulator [Phaeocystidibacter luteus]
MIFNGPTNEYFEVSELDSANHHIVSESRKSELSLLWFTEDNNILEIDAVEHSFQKNEVVSLTEFHKVDASKVTKARFLRFNRAFYCILDHDSEVGCKGILYYGSSSLPKIKLEGKSLDVLETVWKLLEIEMASADQLQQEMLQMMLKRILILITRVYKEGKAYDELNDSNENVIRQFNFLVERHYRKHHDVQSYARMLHKSPKTLSNLFHKLDERTPLQFIKDRLALESRRLLAYTDYNVSEIADQLGFNDIQSFSRFFKKVHNQSPSEYKEAPLGKIDKPEGKVD